LCFRSIDEKCGGEREAVFQNPSVIFSEHETDQPSNIAMKEEQLTENSGEKKDCSKNLNEAHKHISNLS